MTTTTTTTIAATAPCTMDTNNESTCTTTTCCTAEWEALLLADLEDGMLRSVHWDATTLEWTASVLPTSCLTELALVECTFDNEETWSALLQLLVQQPTLVQVSIAMMDWSPYMAALAVVLREHPECSWKALELVALQNRLDDAQAVHLQTLVTYASLHSLTLSLPFKQKDYTATLSALQSGWKQRQNQTNPSPLLRIALHNVCFANHEYLLHRFLAQLCDTPCIDTLQLHTRRQRHATNTTDAMQIGPGFLPGLARLFALGHVRSLHVPHMALDHDGPPVDPRLLADIRHALQSNTTLQHLSLPSTRGLQTVWSQAIFPALATSNRTVTSLALGTEAVPSFLQTLPRLSAVSCVTQVPWRAVDGPDWMLALRAQSTLRQVHFVLPLSMQYNNKKAQSPLYAAVQDLLQRNVLLDAAQDMVAKEPSAEQLVTALADLTAVDNNTSTTTDIGLDARFVLMQESLALFV